MSKIGKRPIQIPEGVELTMEKHAVTVKGNKGTLVLALLPHVTVAVSDQMLKVNATETRPQARANWGTMAALIKNAIRGVSEGFTKTLEIEGIGYRASMEGPTLVLNVGFTHQVKFVPPSGVTIAVEKNQIKVSGTDRALVGEAAAQIRRIKKPEPYKGKGIRYQNEVIRRKAGKKVAGAGTGGQA